MAHPRQQQDDSLELLLDTICNVFGGLILIAILVVLQTQLGVQNVTAPLQAEQLDPQQANARYESLSQDILSARQKREVLVQASPQPPSAKTEQLISKWSQFQDEISRTRTELKNLNKQLKQQELALRATVAESANADRNLKTSQQQLARTEKRLRIVSQIMNRTVRLPKRHNRPDLSSRDFMLEGKRIYPMTDDYRHWTRSLIGPNEYKGTPKEGMGFSLQGEQIATTAAARHIAQGSANRYKLVFFVRADDTSIESFQKLRAWATEKGYSYTLFWYTPETGCTFGYTSSDIPVE